MAEAEGLMGIVGRPWRVYQVNTVGCQGVSMSSKNIC